MISPKRLLFIPIFFPPCVDKPFILGTDILFNYIFWVCIAFFRSTWHRPAKVRPLLSHCIAWAVSWIPAELCVYSGCVWSRGLTVLRCLSQRYSAVQCCSLNLPLKHNCWYFNFLYSSFILPRMLPWFSLIFFLMRPLCFSGCLQHTYRCALPSVSAASRQTVRSQESQNHRITEW